MLPLLFGWSEVLIIALVVLVIFGAAKIPSLMRNLGKGVRSFKEGLKDIDDDEPKKLDSSDKS